MKTCASATLDGVHFGEGPSAASKVALDVLSSVTNQEAALDSNRLMYFRGGKAFEDFVCLFQNVICTLACFYLKVPKE